MREIISILGEYDIGGDENGGMDDFFLTDGTLGTKLLGRLSSTSVWASGSRGSSALRKLLSRCADADQTPS